MKRLIILFSFLLVVKFQTYGQNPSTIQVNSYEFGQLIKNEIGVLLDVRTQREFQNGHIPDAGNLNYYAFDFRKRLMRELKLVMVPYLVLYRNGEMVFDHRGVMKREEVVSLLESNMPGTGKP